MASPKDLTIINVPSDIGSMIKGKHLGPAAFRAVHFGSKLSSIGYNVYETEALDSPKIWSNEAGFGPNGVRNEEDNVKVNQDVKKAVAQTLVDATGEDLPFQLILGGECNIVPAILSAMWEKLTPKRVGLMYVDADADLTIPGEPGSSGNLASMTFTHLNLRPGALESMKQFCRPDGQGVVDPSNAVIFGLNRTHPGNTRDQMGYLFDDNYRIITSTAVAADPIGRAQQALEWLEERVDCILVHLDVDAIDATSFPLANVPNRTGADFETVMQSMKVFLKSEKVVGLCIGEVNPDHDPGLNMMERLVDELTKAFERRLR